MLTLQGKLHICPAEASPHVGLERSENEECGRGEAWNPPLAAEDGYTVCREEDAAGARGLVARMGQGPTTESEPGSERAVLQL
jgi:hypothetical protein